MKGEFGYLFDEQMPALLVDYLKSHFEAVTVAAIGDGSAPPKGRLDPEVLIWCEAHACVLVTNNRRSMPGHLAGHLAKGRQHPRHFRAHTGERA